MGPRPGERGATRGVAPPGGGAGGGGPAPFAAGRVPRLPPYLLGTLVGGLVVLTNMRALLRSDWIDASEQVRYGLYAGFSALWVGAVVYSYLRYRKNRATESAAALAAPRSS